MHRKLMTLFGILPAVLLGTSLLIATSEPRIAHGSTPEADQGDNHYTDEAIHAWRAKPSAGGHENEAYIDEPMPAGFRVVETLVEGPVFADASGKTLYVWPNRGLRNGNAGDNKNESECTAVKTTVNAGLYSPYPPGLVLPDLDQRQSCTEAWPPLRAAADAQPVGSWTIITRKDGIRQWAHGGFAVYTCSLDRKEGDVFGGTFRTYPGFDPVVRNPIGPAPDIPPGFKVVPSALGRLLATNDGYSVYASDGDTPRTSNCNGECLKVWTPVAAPDIAHPHGEWSILERFPGVKQWVFRGKPLYHYTLDYLHPGSLRGGDVEGWHNVFLRMTPPPPREFTVQDTVTGQVLADAQGRTIYVYTCGDDSYDQLGCDHPSQTQAYRLAMCGGGDPLRCMKTFPYLIAPDNAPRTAAWSAIDIDPTTGRLASPGQQGVLHVWAYRDRPVYKYAGDQQPGEINGDTHGEFFAQRNGYKAFWLRDDYYAYEH